MNMVQMWQPMSNFWSLCNSSSICTLKRMGDNTSPCRTPLDTLVENELVPFYVLFILWLVYISNAILKITPGMFLSVTGGISQENWPYQRLWWHKKHTYTLCCCQRCSEKRSRAWQQCTWKLNVLVRMKIANYYTLTRCYIYLSL